MFFLLTKYTFDLLLENYYLQYKIHHSPIEFKTFISVNFEFHKHELSHIITSIFKYVSEYLSQDEKIIFNEILQSVKNKFIISEMNQPALHLNDLSSLLSKYEKSSWLFLIIDLLQMMTSEKFNIYHIKSILTISKIDQIYLIEKSYYEFLIYYFNTYQIYDILLTEEVLLSKNTTLINSFKIQFSQELLARILNIATPPIEIFPFFYRHAMQNKDDALLFPLLKTFTYFLKQDIYTYQQYLEFLKHTSSIQHNLSALILNYQQCSMQKQFPTEIAENRYQDIILFLDQHFSQSKIDHIFISNHIGELFVLAKYNLDDLPIYETFFLKQKNLFCIQLLNSIDILDSYNLSLLRFLLKIINQVYNDHNQIKFSLLMFTKFIQNNDLSCLTEYKNYIESLPKQELKQTLENLIDEFTSLTNLYGDYETEYSTIELMINNAYEDILNFILCEFRANEEQQIRESIRLHIKEFKEISSFNFSFNDVPNLNAYSSYTKTIQLVNLFCYDNAVLKDSLMSEISNASNNFI